jgi:hypothetical protein
MNVTHIDYYIWETYGQHQTTGAKRGEAQTRPGPMQGAHH